MLYLYTVQITIVLRIFRSECKIVYTYLFEGSICYREKEEEDTTETESLYDAISQDHVEPLMKKRVSLIMLNMGSELL